MYKDSKPKDNWSVQYPIMYPIRGTLGILYWRTTLRNIAFMGCAKAEIWHHAHECKVLLHCAELLRGNNILILY